MSINTAHCSNGVLFYPLEQLLLYTDKAVLDITGENIVPFHGLKYGRLYVTTHRLIFRSKVVDAWLQSASFPYVSCSFFKLKEINLMPKVYLEGKVKPQANSHMNNEITLRIQLGNGADEVLRIFLNWCIAMVRANARRQEISKIPPYTMPSLWFEASEASYQPAEVLKPYIPDHPNFYAPEPNTIYSVASDPPFIGILDNGVKKQEEGACSIAPPICCHRTVPPSINDLIKKPSPAKKAFEPGCRHLLPVCRPIEFPKPVMVDVGQQFTTSFYRLLAARRPATT